MAEMTDYAQPLRAIGQALEVLNIQAFEMEVTKDKFFVRGTVGDLDTNRWKQKDVQSKIRSVWGALMESDHADHQEDSWSRKGGRRSIDLCYTLEDVERLEGVGRARRGNSQAKADITSLSQILRSVGGYLSKKSASLIKVTRETKLVTVEYETSLGNRMKETFSAQDLYDLWVGMYLQRVERMAH